MTTFKEWILENYDKDELTDIALHGCGSCCPGGLIYYHETTVAYDKYSDEIWDLLEEIRESLGCANVLELLGTFNGAKRVLCDMSFKNLMVWFYVEETARNATEEEE